MTLYSCGVTMIGDKHNPIRCSKLIDIVKCSARVHMLKILTDDEEDAGQESAQTGSLTHVGVAEFHRTKGKLEIRKGAAIEAIKNAAPKFPLASLDDVRLLITPYMDDPRNINAVMAKDKEGKEVIEYEMRFCLPPHPFDKTGELIHVWGHVDQLRIETGKPIVVDYKSGKKTGWEMVHDYALQIAGYTYGVRQLEWPNAEPGYIIRGMGYRTRKAQNASLCDNPLAPDGVFFRMPFQWNTVPILLEDVTLEIALMRMNHIRFGTGPHCAAYCEFGGLTGCQKTWVDLGRRNLV